MTRAAGKREKMTPSLMDMLEIYALGEETRNEDLYRAMADRGHLDKEGLARLEPIGKEGHRHSKEARKARWMQQTLKRLGLLEKTGKRGVWRLTREGRAKVELRQAVGITMLGFSTKYGIAIWGDAKAVFERIDEPITLVLTSPPYPIRYGRAYGKWGDGEIVDFIVGVLEPVVKNLVDGGSIMLNLGNDVFMPGRPARSMWIERLMLRLHDDLGLELCDRIVWQNPQKPPSPTQWACVERYHLAAQHELVIWMSNNAAALKTDNRRVLLPLSESHKRLVEKGGEKCARSFGDGAHEIRRGAFSKLPEGSIPKNILRYGHGTSSTRQYRAFCKEAGIPAHGAMFPYEIAEFLVKFGSAEGDLVADPFGGAMTTALAAHANRRRFITTEMMGEYVYGGAMRFGDDVVVNPALARLHKHTISPERREIVHALPS